VDFYISVVHLAMNECNNQPVDMKCDTLYSVSMHSYKIRFILIFGYVRMLVYICHYTFLDNQLLNTSFHNASHLFEPSLTSRLYYQ